MAGTGTDKSGNSLAAKFGDQGEAILNAILSATPECIKIVARDGSVLYMNAAGLQIVGIAEESEIDGACVFDVIAPEDRETWISMHRRVCDGEQLKWEFDIIDTRGFRHNMETNAVPLKLPDGSFAQLAITRDVTRRKANQRELRLSQARSQSLLEAIPAAIYTTDNEGNITFFNDAAVEFAGRRPELGEKWCVSWKLHNLDGSPLPHDECPMAIALKEKRPVRGVEAVAEGPDGTRRTFMAYPTPLLDDTGGMLGAVNMLIDTTERHEAETNSAYLASIISSSDDAIVSKTLTGHVTSWNAGAERLFGYSAEEMIGQPIIRLIPPELRGEEDEILARLRSGQRIDHFDTTRVTKDGRRIDVSITVSPVRGPSGRLIGASKIARDISQRKYAESLRTCWLRSLTTASRTRSPPYRRSPTRLCGMRAGPANSQRALPAACRRWRAPIRC